MWLLGVGGGLSKMKQKLIDHFHFLVRSEYDFGYISIHFLAEFCKF